MYDMQHMLKRSDFVECQARVTRSAEGVRESSIRHLCTKSSRPVSALVTVDVS